MSAINFVPRKNQMGITSGIWIAESPGVEDDIIGVEAIGERRGDVKVILFYNSTREHPMETPNAYISRNELSCIFQS